MTELIDLQEIKLIKKLKDLILAEARALYGPSYPLINHFEVVTASRVSFLNDARHNYITAQLIVYPKQSSLAQWKLLAVGIERDSVSGALKSLWTELQSKMQIAIGPMQLGDTYKGSKSV